MLLFKINDSYCEYDIGTKQNYCQLLNEKQGALNQALGMTEWPRHPKYKFYLYFNYSATPEMLKG